MPDKDHATKSDKAEAKTAHAAEVKAEKDADAAAEAKKKRFSTGILGYLAELTPTERANVYAFFSIPQGDKVFKADGTIDAAWAGKENLWDNFHNLEEAHKQYGDDLALWVCDCAELASGKYVPAPEEK